MISCVINTYRRFTCVNRAIRLFLNQTFRDAELVIYNTDVEYPLMRGPDLPNNVYVINAGRDRATSQPYTDLGSVRRDSLIYARGSHYVCWDDDDIFLPWFLEQCVDGMARHPRAWAWKPHTSLFWKTGCDPELAGNNMEASVLVDLDALRAFGFAAHQGGGEHLSWFEGFTKCGKMVVDRDSIPSYCFNWADQGLMRGHKQSGTIDRADNFAYHKANTNDYATGPLTGECDVQPIYDAHIAAIKRAVGVVQPDGYVVQARLVEHYVR